VDNRHFFCPCISVNTEITDKVIIEGWVLYDADCLFCTRLARRFRPWLVRRHLELLPLQTPWVRARLGLTDSRLLAEMRVLLPDGTHFGGADALMEISRRYWWTWPFRQMTRLPAMMKLLRRGYRGVARRRGCVWLFHPWFIKDVIQPMLSAIGAT